MKIVHSAVRTDVVYVRPSQCVVRRDGQAVTVTRAWYGDLAMITTVVDVMITVDEYDPTWPALAAAACAEIIAALDGSLSRIEHIGSTAVPGLAAKPIIDLMAATPSLAAVAARTASLNDLGFRLIETGMPERFLYRRDGVPIAYHLHVVTESSWDDRNERILRDHLLEHPSEAADYGRLKRRLAAAGHDGNSYTRAKTALIQEMVDRARTRRGLPLVPVWED